MSQEATSEGSDGKYDTASKTKTMTSGRNQEVAIMESESNLPS